MSEIDELKKRVAELERDASDLRHVLHFAQGAIRDAVLLDDGLDGTKGGAVLEIIAKALEASDAVISAQATTEEAS